MDRYIWELLIVCIGLFAALIGVVYRNIIDKISSKVDIAEFKTVREWEKELYKEIRESFKDFNEENSNAHKEIISEIKKLFHDK